MWLLNLFKKEGVEIVSREDMDDLKLLRATRGEEAIPFEEHLTETKACYQTAGRSTYILN